MTDVVVLDTGILGQVTHPRRKPEFGEWFEDLLSTDTDTIVAEIADYEVRRELVRAGKIAGIARLDKIKRDLIYLPITTAVMLRAADLWAQARRRGRPTAAPSELDCDVILAAQALGANAAVVTDNIGHLSLFVDALSWRDWQSLASG